MLQAKGAYDAAEPLLREALAIFEETLPLDHPDIRRTVDSLAVLLRERGREAEAAAL